MLPIGRDDEAHSSLWSTCNQNGLDKCLGHFCWHGGIEIAKGTLAKPHRLLVGFQVALAVLAGAEVVVEADSVGRRKLTGKIVDHEVGKFTARHARSPGPGRA